jgi:hypothetical protein
MWQVNAFDGGDESPDVRVKRQLVDRERELEGLEPRHPSTPFMRMGQDLSREFETGPPGRVIALITESS